MNQICKMWRQFFTCFICLFLSNQAYSKVPVECRRSTEGLDYTGHRNTTVSGRTCQAWKSQFPHPHKFNDSRLFPDDTLEDARNYCRNPAPDPKLAGPWCYTTDPNVEWELCAKIPACSEFPECRLTDAGTEYKGFISKTRAGVGCVQWPSMDTDDVNYCRNPDNKPQGPWCYTDLDYNWDFCNIPFCKPSSYCRLTPTGQEYIGTVSNTGAGVPCQRWDSQFPHPHPIYTVSSSAFPDATVSDAANYCRNPDGRSTGPWCYTRDYNVKQEPCDIPICRDCKISNNGVEYSGSLSVTKSSRLCLAWSGLKSIKAALKDLNRFPDASLVNASNFCRNPDRKAGGPWCYWADEPASWEYCNIPPCTGKTQDTFKPRIAKHILHIGIDGMHPCFVNCSTGAPNLLKRIAAAGTSTLHMGRTVLETVSAPGWTAILCGMSIETTGVTGNDWSAPWKSFPQPITPVMGPTVPFPCVWHQIKSQDRTIRTAAFTNWDWFRYITSMGMPEALDYDYFCEDCSTCDAELVSNATSYLKQNFRSAESSYTFVYIGNVDETGHKHGWCGKEYLEYVNVADKLVGELLDVVDASGLADRITVMVSADHGGHNRGHGSHADSDIRVPILIRGPGIIKGGSFRHEVRNMDFSPTALESLGLKQSKWWKGDVMWEAFESRS